MYEIGINDKLKQAFKEEAGEDFDDLPLSSKRGYHATYSLPKQHPDFFARSLGDMGFGSSDSVKSFQQLNDRSAMCMDRLDSAKLIRQHDSHGIHFTVLGIAFIEACQPPKPKA